MQSNQKNLDKMLFVHDHKFHKHQGQYYSGGGISRDSLREYTQCTNKLTLIGRHRNSNGTVSKKLTKLDSNDINFITKEKYQNWFKKRSIKELKLNIDNSDIIIIRLPSLLGFLAYFLCKRKKSLVIEVAGDALLSYGYSGFYGKLLSLPFHFLMKRIVSKSEYVIYVTKEYLQKRYPNKKTNTNISNVIVHPSVKRKDYSSFLFKQSKINLVTIGNLDVKYKGYIDVLKFIYKYKERYSAKIVYNIIGGGSGIWLKKYIEKFGLQDNVKFCGTIPREDIEDKLSEMDIYVHTSRTEGLPRSVIEAMSIGCICIATDTGGTSELIQNEYLYKPGDIEKLNYIFNYCCHNIMQETSKENYYKSNEYSFEVLKEKRKKFINGVKND